MSWLSSLFKGKKTTQPDTSAQEAEAARQSAAEQARLQALLDQQMKMWQQQRTDDQTRYTTQLAAQQAEAERQRQAAQTENDRQYQAQQQQVAQQQAERQAQEAQAAQHAKLSRDYATGRQTLLDQNKAGIDQAYAGFNDDAYKGFAQSFVNYYKPQAEKTYQDATRDTTFGYADAHNLRSSAAAKSFGDLVGQLHQNEGKIANAAGDATNEYRGQIDQQKSDALGLLYQAAGTANPNLPDGFTDGDLSSTLGGLGSQLGGITNAAASRAKTSKAPSFGATNLDLSMRVKKPAGSMVVG